MVRTTDPVTSRQAAEGVERKKDADRVREAIHRYSHLHPDGMTRHEISEYVVLGKLDPEFRELRARIKSINKRVTDLKTDGDIVETGKKLGRESLVTWRTPPVPEQLELFDEVKRMAGYDS